MMILNIEILVRDCVSWRRLISMNINQDGAEIIKNKCNIEWELNEIITKEFPNVEWKPNSLNILNVRKLNSKKSILELLMF